MPATKEADPQRLAELRAKIDAIDESVHRLLIQRAGVIDELIEVKGTARNGAAFRPGREADMMRRLAARHSGNLPLTAVEHLWREIISTFTALQAPFAVAVSKGADATGAVEAARFTFGFSVPLRVFEDAEDVVAWLEEGGDRLGVVLLAQSGRSWWSALKTAQVVARLPFFRKRGREAAAPALVLAPPLADPVPFEIGCFALAGDRNAIRSVASLSAIETLAEASAGEGEVRLVAAPDAAALASAARAAGLDIRPVGGYAAPLEVDR